MRAEIISVGTELLLGDILNTNAQYLAQQMASLGFSVYYQTVVGDNATRLRHLVAEAKSRSDILVFTGGLGPTDDDLTKETVAELFGDSLVLDEGELDKLEEYFRKRGKTMAPSNRKQAMVPLRGITLENPGGTAPGAWFRQGAKYAVLLPGPPREMKPMFENQVMPLLEALQDSSIRSVTLRVFGVGESALEEIVRPLLEGDNPTAALYAKTGEVHIRITAKAPTAGQADVMCDECAAQFRKVLGDVIYSDNSDDLETTVVRLLLEDGKTLATAESCTGGLLSQRITSVPGSSGVFGYGAVTYANEAKHEMLGVRNSTLRRYGAVSSQVAAEMAFGAAKHAGADYGVGITGIAGPNGGSDQKPVGLVYIALADGRNVYVKKPGMYVPMRDYIRTSATHHALDMIRRAALGLSIPEAKQFTKGQQADFARSGKPKRRGGALGRAVTAVVMVLVLLALVLLGAWFSRGTPRQDTSTPSLSYPSAQGLQYGTAAYNNAACTLVEEAAGQDALVTGMVSLSGGLESLVIRADEGDQNALAAAAADPSAAGRPVVAAGAAPGQAARNVVVLGGQDFEPLWSYLDVQAKRPPASFTWFTERDIRVYRVFALYVDDAAGGFSPLVPSVASYGVFMDFMLGAKVRSVYDVPLDIAQGDSFMTLAVPSAEAEGHTLYLCGRLAHEGERTDAVAGSSAAGTPLMPDSYYSAGDEMPSERGLYTTWLRWYLTGDTTNSQLQLGAGMPAADTIPTVQPDSGVSPGALYSARRVLSPPRTSLMSSIASTSTSESDSESASVSAEGDESDSAPSSVSQPPSSSFGPPAAVAPMPQRTDPRYLSVTMNGEVVTAPTAEVLAMICQNEAAGLEREAVKALAVAAHSWILNRQGAGDAAPQVVGRPASADILAAVREVENQVLSADGAAPAFTPYYAMAAFGTNTPSGIWGGSRAYLSQTPSPFDQSLDGWRHITSLSSETLVAAAQDKLGVDLGAFGAPESWLVVTSKNDGGYVEKMTVGGVEVTGYTFWRHVLPMQAEPVLYSPAFEVEYDGANFTFISYGQGHGVGLSLAGASSYARQGMGYQQILEHYYPGIRFITWPG